MDQNAKKYQRYRKVRHDTLIRPNKNGNLFQFAKCHPFQFDVFFIGLDFRLSKEKVNNKML